MAPWSADKGSGQPQIENTIITFPSITFEVMTSAYVRVEERETGVYVFVCVCVCIHVRVCQAVWLTPEGWPSLHIHVLLWSHMDKGQITESPLLDAFQNYDQESLGDNCLWMTEEECIQSCSPQVFPTTTVPQRKCFTQQSGESMVMGSGCVAFFFCLLCEIWRVFGSGFWRLWVGWHICRESGTLRSPPSHMTSASKVVA